jgi:hypothetical protein
MKKLMAIVALTASVLATPAFAQSFDWGVRNGNALPSGYDRGGFLYNDAAARQDGFQVYNMGAQDPWSDRNGRVVTGGVQPVH